MSSTGGRRWRWCRGPESAAVVEVGVDELEGQGAPTRVGRRGPPELACVGRVSGSRSCRPLGPRRWTREIRRLLGLSVGREVDRADDWSGVDHDRAGAEVGRDDQRAVQDRRPELAAPAAGCRSWSHRGEAETLREAELLEAERRRSRRIGAGVAVAALAGAADTATDPPTRPATTRTGRRPGGGDAEAAPHLVAGRRLWTVDGCRVPGPYRRRGSRHVRRQQRQRRLPIASSSG